MEKKNLSNYLGIIIIIAILLLFSLPAIDKTIKNTQSTAYNSYIDKIKEASKKWVRENTNLLPNENESITIYYSELKRLGLVQNITNPMTRKKVSNYTSIVISKANNNYNYEVNIIDAKSKEDDTLPILIINGSIVDYVEVNQENNDYIVPKAIAKTSTGESIPSSYITYQILKNNEVVSKINTDKLDTYIINYTVTYKDKTANYQKKVIVRDTLHPTIEITGLLKMNTRSVYKDLMKGVIVKDNSGESIIPIIKSTISNIAGNYYVYYQATDSSGNIVIDKREIEIYNSEKYENGEIIYFDPIKNQICNNYSIDNSKLGFKEGCMKWYVVKDNNSKLNLLLDHNISTNINYISLEDYINDGGTLSTWGTGNNTHGPITLNKQLKEDTKNWDKVLNARLISANEVASITLNNWDSNSTLIEGFYFETNSQKLSITCTKENLSNCNYGWLSDRSSFNCKDFGCLNSEPQTTGYWTSSPNTNYKYGAWVVNGIGMLTNDDIKNNVSYGIRPVITIEKKLLNK